jgi:hypothetical protein
MQRLLWLRGGLNHGEHGHAPSVGGPEPFLASEPLTESTGMPPEDIPGEAANVDFAG